MTTSFLRTLFHAKLGYKLRYKERSKDDYFGRTWWLEKNGHYLLSIWESEIINNGE